MKRKRIVAWVFAWVLALTPVSILDPPLAFAQENAEEAADVEEDIEEVLDEDINEAPDEALEEDEYVEVAPYSDFSEPWAYVRAGTVQAISFIDAPAVPSQWGIEIAVGARLHKYFAAEFDFQAVPYWKLDGGEISSYAAMLNGKFYVPIRRFHLFAVAGLGLMVSERARESTARFAYLFGAGVDFYVTDSIYLTATYNGHVGNLDDFGYSNMVYSIGYRFY